MCFHNTVLKIYGNLEKEQLVGKNLTLYGFKLRYVGIINGYTVDIIKILKSFLQKIFFFIMNQFN